MSGVAAAPPAEARPAERDRSAVVPVTLQVNGRRHELQPEPRVTLLDALRAYAGLTGTKKGCDHGQCGACTVLVGGSGGGSGVRHRPCAARGQDRLCNRSPAR